MWPSGWALASPWWTWGSGPSGRIWEDILTEGGGAYFEPQAGAWSDNQPDYHWMSPNEVKTTHDYWYPVRDSRGVSSGLAAARCICGAA